MDPKTESSHPKISRNISSKGLFLLHLAAMMVGGPVENTYTHTHTHCISIIHRCMVQVCKVDFDRAVAILFISNEQIYTMSTHALECMYSNI